MTFPSSSSEVAVENRLAVVGNSQAAVKEVQYGNQDLTKYNRQLNKINCNFSTLID